MSNKNRVCPIVTPVRPTLAVYKFASCDGCQLSILNLEDDLLALGETLDIAYFPEASSEMRNGPYDIVLVEGSITTPDDAHRIPAVRQQAKTLITIGACATAGGIQALRNWSDVETFKQVVWYQFKSIAALGPIFGPIIAVQWGWLPALLWITFGTFFIGWVQDYASIMMGVREEGQSFGALSYRLISPRSRMILLIFILLLSLADHGIVRCASRL